MLKIILSACLLLVLASCPVTHKMSQTARKTVMSDAHFKNAHFGIAIMEAQSGKPLYQYQANKYFVPASNTKLASCYVAMKYLEDSLPGIQYHILNDTTVWIAGTGDPTVLHPDFKEQPVYHFPKQFREVRVFNSEFNDYLGSGWSWNDYTEDYMAPRSNLPLYGNVVRFKIENGKVWCVPSHFQNKVVIQGNPIEGMSIDRPWDENRFVISKGRSENVDVPFVPAGSTILNLLADTLQARLLSEDSLPEGDQFVYSHPLDSMLALMMHRSDNFFAEQCLLMVSQKLTGKMNDREIIRRVLATDLKNLPQPPGWVDGSGLSRYNLFSPLDFITILRKMKDEFGMPRLKVILPTGGTGTLSSLYKNDAGYIFAKTGTLNGVVALSGYLYTKKNKLLLFSVLVNHHRSSAADIRRGIEKFLIQIRNSY